MEKSVDHMRKQNEKLAKAIRRVKDDPSILEAVEKITANGQINLESQVESAELRRLREEVSNERRKKQQVEENSNDLDAQIVALQAEFEEMEKLLIDYADPLQKVEKAIKTAENDQIKQEFEKQRQEGVEAARREREERERKLKLEQDDLARKREQDTIESEAKDKEMRQKQK